MGESFYPLAEKRVIKAGDNDPYIVPTLAILHVAVTEARTLRDWFRSPKAGGVESHFYIRKDGTVEQYRSVRREADANYRANSYVVGGVRMGAVSIETAGFGNGRWTRKQMKAIKALLLWLHEEHGIRLAPPVAPQPLNKEQGGVSYHTRFKSWSNVAGKTCPGPSRIMQYTKVLMPWMREQRECLHCPVHCPKGK